MLSEMERVGTAIDIDHFKWLSEMMYGRMVELEGQIKKRIPTDKLREFLNRKGKGDVSEEDVESTTDSANIEDANDDQLDGDILAAFNVNSAEKVAWLLFDLLGLGKGEVLKTTADGKRISTGKKQLERLKEEHEIVGELLEYRELAKLKSTYVDKLPKIAVRHDKGTCWCGLKHLTVTWRVHTTFLTTRTETGRPSSKAPNLQNIPARTDLGRLTREGFIASPGMLWVSVDKSQIELRGLANCAGEDNMTRIYLNGGDIHVETARAAFKLGPDDKVDKYLHRAPAKTVNFGVCLTKGQRVLTDTGLVAIENVTCQHRVWDGVEFVSHGGVVFNGYREVIAYAGISATPEHVVFTHEAGPVALEEAMAKGYRLVASGSAEHPIKIRIKSDEMEHSQRGEIIPLRGSCLRHLQTHRQCKYGQLVTGKNTGLQLSAIRIKYQSSMCGSSTRQVLRHCSTLRQPGQRKLSQLRWTWSTKQVQVGQRVCRVCTGVSSTSGLSQAGHWTDRQQRALRTGEYSTRGPGEQPAEQKNKSICHVQRQEGYSHGSVRSSEEGLPGFLAKSLSNNQTCHAGGKLSVDSTAETTRPIQKVIAPVYDILDAGPRNRFTIEGKLVHNCYGMSASGLLAQLILMFHQDNKPVPQWLTEEWCEQFIQTWFSLYPQVKDYMDWLVKMVHRYGIVWNDFGRVRQIHGVWSCHRHIISECERQAGNMPIQGWAAEIMKIWMMLVLAADGTGMINEWREHGLVYPLLTVHDELNLECEPHMAEMIKSDLMMAEEYIGAEFGFKCPLKAEGDVYDRWKK